MHSPAAPSTRGQPDADGPARRGRIATRLRLLHRLFARLGFYPAALCTLIGVALVAARWARSGSPAYAFLVWNLFLAWLPWLFMVPLAATRSQSGSGRRLLPVFAAWLLFLPNAPYLVTDLLHLKPTGGIPLWYDAALLFVFAWTGCLLGFLSLAAVHGRIERWLGRAAGWIFVGVVCVLCGYGIYLGRFLRWNSWDLVAQPLALLGDVAGHVLEPGRHPRTVAVTGLFAVFLAAGYGSFAGLRRRRFACAERVEPRSA